MRSRLVILAAAARALHAEHDEAPCAESPEVGKAYRRPQLAQLGLLPRPVGRKAEWVQLRASRQAKLDLQVALKQQDNIWTLIHSS